MITDLATLITSELKEQINDVYWIKNTIDNELTNISVVFNINNISNLGTFDQPVIIRKYLVDVYLNIPEDKIKLLGNKSIYIKNKMLNLSSIDEHVKYVRFENEEVERLDDTNIFSNRKSFEVQYIE